jgi:hypothetical protein
VGQVGSSAEDYQLVCATYKSVAALDEALDEVLPDGGARRIIPVYSCMVPSLETTCTAAKSYSAHRFNFDLPSDAHWLFFGPSYLKEIANSIIAGTAGEIVGTADPFPTEGTKLPRLRSPSPSLLLSPKDQCGTKSALTHCEPTAVLDERFTLTFANGAKLTSVTNDAQTQDEGDPEAMARLEKMLPDGKFTHAFYMPPHEPDYFAEHAAADKDGRSVNSSVLGHTNCCVSDAGLDGFHQCVESRLTWQAVKRHVKRTTLVTPFNLGQASSSASSSADVFYTDYIDRVYPCGVAVSGVTVDDPIYGVGNQLDSKEWLELGGGCHRCTVVCEAADGSVDAPPSRCVGGPVLVLAEELLRSHVRSL